MATTRTNKNWRKFLKLKKEVRLLNKGFSVRFDAGERKGIYQRILCVLGISAGCKESAKKELNALDVKIPE